MAWLWLLIVDSLNSCKEDFQCCYDESDLVGLEGADDDANEVACVNGVSLISSDLTCQKA